ncbi:MAG: 50S ribosomal protein L9 [Clostridiales bacterium]|nr:50S ribosomal protein L9 [Clostridiales bacterium]MCF8022495.1 50S ribosomal protein L9 [Clostridiales bacterium]
MKVILLDEVKKLGQKGDVVNVADGYARNYLMPKGLASEATKDKINELEYEKEIEAEKRAKEEEQARELAEKIENIKVTLSVKVGEAGKLFGAVSNKDIADVLNKKHNLGLDKKKIVLKDPIKALGDYNLTVKLHPNVQANLNVQILKE